MKTQINLRCEVCGEKIRPMHGVNNGPTGSAAYERRSNFESFAALHIPYVRNHDASLSEAYGSQHVVDVHCIFPNFDRDADDETAYDFAITDYYTRTILEAGSKVFYRLGSSIEHWAHKYGTRKPKNFQKWVDVCEHIILHYTEGWADGYHWDMPYWEIWNEADLDADNATDKRTWGGTKAEFFDLFALAAKQLKGRFPHLKIGGPALAFDEAWADDFLGEMKSRSVPLDFFSWHIYTTDPRMISQKAERIEGLLQKNGYGNVESILNEWNYVKDWADPLYFLRVIKGLKGASFTTAVMCEMQTRTRVDSLMYYDARVEKIWNGLFDSDTLLPLKGYYAFRAFDQLYQLGQAVSVDGAEHPIYACAAQSEKQLALLVTNYDDNEPEGQTLDIRLPEGYRTAEVYRLNETADLAPGEKIPLSSETLALELPAYHVCLVVLERE